MSNFVRVQLDRQLPENTLDSFLVIFRVYPCEEKKKLSLRPHALVAEGLIRE
jgi:hypothetical protein